MGYCSDMSRTFYFCGENDKRREFEAVYGIVLAALEAGQGAAVLGGRMEDVDNAARRVIAEAGYGKYFTHRTGHGIGIDTHEEPCAASGDGLRRSDHHTRTCGFTCPCTAVCVPRSGNGFRASGLAEYQHISRGVQVPGFRVREERLWNFC